MGAHRRIVVIGGGPAGVQAALAAAGSGQQVTIISDGPPGGRAAWQTLLPSKMWLGATPGEPLRLADLRERYEQVAGAWQRQILEQLEQAGATLMLGSAAFLSPHEIAVTPPEGGYPDQLSADAIIIATGAVPFVPPGLEPDGVRVFSPHRVWDITKLPDDMIVIGAGGPATEYVDAFSRLGARITWITGPVGVLSAFPPDAGRFISAVMEKRGVQIITGLVARQIERGESGVRVITSGRAYEASAAFVAIGLRPDLKRLNLEAAGLRAGTSGSLVADLYGRTAQPHIYLAGDAASPISANIAIAQGRMAGWHAAGVEIGPTTMETGVMAIYTSPQVALVGHMTERGAAIQKVRVPFHACLRAHLMRPHSAWQEATGMHPDTEQEGFLEVAFAAEAPRRITGALAVCPEAAEVLTPLAVAVRAGMTVDELAGVYAGHPTFSELAILAARMAR